MFMKNADRTFYWNNEKAARNVQRHGISFAQATRAFHDPFRVEWIDDREDYGEERISFLGMYGDVLLHVTYTERGNTVWLILARRAEKHEQDDYYRENST
jgi:uncharacterized DUF497 family protein